MKLSFEWQEIFLKYADYFFIVEGKKDVESLNSVGFDRVFVLNKPGISLKERIEEIVSFVEKKDVVCILTDFDKKGKQLYFILKREFQTLGVRLDCSLRGILLRAGVSHIEGLDSFMERLGRKG